jgi:hypothetical protein
VDSLNIDSKRPMKIGRQDPTALILLVGTILFCAVPRPILGNLFVGNPSNGTVGEYTDSGQPINPSLITGLFFPSSIAVSGGFVYVANALPGTVGKYTTSGETINASLISGLNGLPDIEVSGGDLYLINQNSLTGTGQVGKYTTFGAIVNASLIPGIYPTSLAVSGNELFVVEGGRVGEYTTSGSTVNASLIRLPPDFAVWDIEVSGSSLFTTYNVDDSALVGKYNINGATIDPRLIERPGGNIYGNFAISGTDLFVTGGEVGKYTTSGTLVADPLITTESSIGATGIAVDESATVPETLSSLWLGLTVVGLLGCARLVRVPNRRSR